MSESQSAQSVWTDEDIDALAGAINDHILANPGHGGWWKNFDESERDYWMSKVRAMVECCAPVVPASREEVEATLARTLRAARGAEHYPEIWFLIGPTRQVNDTEDSVLVDGQCPQLQAGETRQVVPLNRARAAEAGRDYYSERAATATGRVRELADALRDLISWAENAPMSMRPEYDWRTQVDAARAVLNRETSDA